MSIIDNFIRQYEKEYDFYKEIARLGHDILETEIINRGIKAMVSSRAKESIDSRKKLKSETKLKTIKIRLLLKRTFLI